MIDPRLTVKERYRGRWEDKVKGQRGRREWGGEGEYTLPTCSPHGLNVPLELSSDYK